MNKTIAAIATAFAPSGLGIVRISGDDAHRVASKIFSPVGKRNIDNVKGFSAILGKLYDSDGVFDDAIATVFFAPKSYTGENAVELSCHGGTYVISRLLRAAFAAGASPAEPGEFTKRAFLNGKLTLDEAEAVIDIINAKSRLSATAAYSAKEGALSRRLNGIISALTKEAAHLAAWVDYPEEDIDAPDTENMLTEFIKTEQELKKLLATYDSGKLIREGISTVIVGKPNVGKSTLMNCLTGENTSIVTDIPGTTRDIVNENILMDDIMLRISDTAGIRQTEDLVESLGVQNAKSKIEGSDLILAVFDGGTTLDAEDKEIIELVKNLPAIAIINKNDLQSKIDIEYIKENISQIVYISAANSDGIPELSSKIKEVCMLGNIDSEGALLYNQRQYKDVAAAILATEEAISAVEMGATLDAVTVCIEEILSHLLALTGKRASEEVVQGVFANFCVGK